MFCSKCGAWAPRDAKFCAYCGDSFVAPEKTVGETVAVFKEPVSETPVADEPVADEPVAEEAAAKAPAVGEPALPSDGETAEKPTTPEVAFLRDEEEPDEEIRDGEAFVCEEPSVSATEEDADGALSDMPELLNRLALEEDEADYEPALEEKRPAKTAEKPVGVLGFLLAIVVSSVPLVGFIVMTVWAAGGAKNRSRADFAVASLIVRICLLAVCIGIAVYLFFSVPAFAETVLSFIRRLNG